MLKGLIFDVDGTLADTERDGHRVAFNAAFRSFGLDWDWNVSLYGELLAITGGKERIRHYLTHHCPGRLMAAGLMPHIPALHKEKTRHYMELLQQGHIPLRPGIRRLLAAARRHGIRLAIATTTTQDNVDTLLSQTLGPAATTWFDVIAAGDVVAQKKPAPDIYHLALRQLGLQPAECLAIEDSENGLRSSLAAGVPTLVTVNAYTRHQCFNGAVAVLSDLGEPGHAFQVLRGDAGGHQYASLDLLQHWHASSALPSAARDSGTHRAP